MYKNALYQLLSLSFLLCGNYRAEAQLFPSLGKQRAGISALSFLKIDVSPRSSGMGGAQIALEGDGYAAYWNAASIASIAQPTFAAANTFYVSETNLAFLSVIYPHRKFGNFALSFTNLGSGPMERRTEFQPLGTGEYFYASYQALGLSYAKKLTERFQYGITLKYLQEQLDRMVARTAALDVGFLYKTDFKQLQFAVVLQHFGPNSSLQGKKYAVPLSKDVTSYESNPSPTVFSMGISMVPLKKENHQLLACLQLNHPNDNAENVRFGVEYGFKEFLFFRGGYKINVKDQPYPTFGAGIRTRIGKHPLIVDYGLDPTLLMGWVHRAGITLSINNEKRTETTPSNE